MDDFPQRIAGFLEATATKVRSLTVDRVAKLVKWVALFPLLLILALAGVTFLLIGSFRLLAEVIGGVRIAYAAIGGLFLVAGVFLWSKRRPKAEEDES